ncbi:MAG: hypothetical protein AAFQ82_17250, partial [Myxococcota bacterium]
MNQIRIDQVRAPQTRSVEEQQQFLRDNHTPLDLFATSNFERVHSVQVDAQRVDIPSFSAEQQAQLATIAARVPAANRDAVNGALNSLTDAIYTAAPTFVPGATIDSGLTQAYDESFQVYMTHSGH